MRAAFAHCEALARAHYENFPVGSRLLPAALRPHVCSIYAFARTADDFADEPGLADAERLEQLDRWRANLHACLDAPDGPIFTALAATIREHEVPVQLLDDLLSAFRQDVLTPRRETFDALIDYCRCSANPVGRLVLHLCGYRDEERAAMSDAICTGLQLANFWQDVAVDFPRGRVYLPQDELDAHGVTDADLAGGHVTDAFRTLLRSLVARTRGYFDAGAALPETVSGRLRIELRLTVLGGRTILDKIERAGCDVFNHRPTVSRLDAFRLLLRALFPVRSTV